MKMWKVYRRTDRRTDRQTDRQTTDERWSEKLTWAFSSGELKTHQKHSSNKTEIQFPDKQFMEATKIFHLNRWNYETSNWHLRFQHHLQITMKRNLSSSISKLDSLSDKCRHKFSLLSISSCSFLCNRRFSSLMCFSSCAYWAIFSSSAKKCVVWNYRLTLFLTICVHVIHV